MILALVFGLLGFARSLDLPCEQGGSAPPVGSCGTTLLRPAYRREPLRTGPNSAGCDLQLWLAAVLRRRVAYDFAGFLHGVRAADDRSSPKPSPESRSEAGPECPSLRGLAPTASPELLPATLTGDEHVTADRSVEVCALSGDPGRVLGVFALHSLSVDHDALAAVPASVTQVVALQVDPRGERGTGAGRDAGAVDAGHRLDRSHHLPCTAPLA